jgi:hypothetical protein
MAPDPAPTDPAPPGPAELRRRLARNPLLEPPTTESPSDRFARLACLVYSEVDGPDRWGRARELLAAEPEIVTHSVAAAAAAAEPGAIAAHLTADPAAAITDCGPFGWPPLLYLTYSRVHDAQVPADRFLSCARLLLDAGADPNAGYLWLGNVPPFTALTGVFGEGEQGPGKQPRHPHAAALGRLLLIAGADPNDGQALYNRMFRPDDDILVVLFEFGLGRTSTGPWPTLLGGDLETPTQLLARMFGWAIDHGFAQRVELLIANGIDVQAPLADGRTPAEHAAAAGYRDIIADLRIAGVSIPDSADLTLVGALLAGDEHGVSEHRSALGALRRSRPALVHQVRDPAAVAVLAAAGFDVNAVHHGKTALHDAAFVGDLALISALLAAGADPSARDADHGSTALDWARYACQPAAAGLLESVGRG